MNLKEKKSRASYLSKRIKSQDTGNKILIRTVLSNPETHPKTYESIKAHFKKTKEKALEKYAEGEFGEYDENFGTKTKFPDAFKSKEEFVSAVKKGKREEIDKDSQVDNSNIADQKKGDYEGLSETIYGFKKEKWDKLGEGDEKKGKALFKKYLDGIIETAKKNSSSLPPAIIGEHTSKRTGKSSKYLLAGNSRAMVFAYLGKPAPVITVPLKGRQRSDRNVAIRDAHHWAIEDAKENGGDKNKLFKSYLKDNGIKLRKKEKRFLKKASPIRGIKAAVPIGVLPYVSPRERMLTPLEEKIREVAYALKKGDPWAIEFAAKIMARMVPPRATLVPIPNSSGSTKSNLLLAEAIADKSGATVVDLLSRKGTVEPSHLLRQKGLSGLSSEKHLFRGDIRLREPIFFIDNVTTTGATFMAAKRALGGLGRGLAFAQAKQASSIRVATQYLSKKAFDTQLINKAKKIFGTTTNINEAGYLLPDGSLLDFSGRHQITTDYEQFGTTFVVKPGKKDWQFNKRPLDHRDVEPLLDRDFSSRTDAMYYFMEKTGAIRLTSDGATILTIPTRIQAQTLSGIGRRYHRGEDFYLDVKKSGSSSNNIRLKAGFGFEKLLETVHKYL